MIGLVVVSHSRALARAAVDLATELLPRQPVRVRIAAGLDEATLGTDAVAVADAIAAADTGDGVLVLMDLGSALLSAETALDLLDTPHIVRLCAAPLVEGLVAALAAAGGGADLEKVAGEADRALDAKRAQLGETVAPLPDSAEPDSTMDSAVVAVFQVRNEHGLHARPAAELVAGLRDLDVVVTLRNATTDVGPVPGESLTRVLTLGVMPGQQLEVTASGPDAQTALARIEALTTGH
ncbi:dihydroxyacetone kinase phosphoryl donor subunit DhaM [Nocardia sp. NPDC088792]|uniref:dihydroxyacetone kinase phosphoryl donor subunit DhaM n=1 Tax=Nocardia sp. NPDC088792 TaxID=3364332 RepID=UPI00380748F5